ncbi:hypothetical protein QVD17_12144 [Tagetes erecta]|uniref:Uncharacterized protein n=1 Tax=Tagetes erecta TaxID=13708 RepID=A0AAD8KVE5_TARER|nr:hypothetical protein QVD17_12144 [Tagetes erecta]
MSTAMFTVIREENKREDINEFITEFNHMFETTYLQVAKACDQKRRDFHEHTKLALVSEANSHENHDEEEYDWSENNDVVSIQEIEKKDKEISNLSETIAKQDETIAQLKSEMEKLMSKKKIKKDENSSYVEMPIEVREKMCTKECFQQVEHYRIYSFKICDKLKKEEQMHKNLKEQHEISDQRITFLEVSIKQKEKEAMNIRNEAAKSNEHSSSVIKDLQEEILKLKKLSEMFNSENNTLKNKLQEEQEKHASLQEDHKMCEDRFKSLTLNVDSMLTEKHNLNVQLMELTDKLNRSQSDLVFIKEEVKKGKSVEKKDEGLVPTGIVGSLSSQEEEEKTQEFQSKKKKKKVRRKKSKAKKNKTKATSSDSTPQTPSTPKSQDSESPSDSNSDVYCLICDSETHHISDCIYSQGVFPYSSKSNKFKTPASSSKFQQDSEVKASTAKTSQKQRKKSPFKAHQKYCEICEMYNHTTMECYYNKYCTNCQIYNHDTMECYYNKYCSICDMVNHNTQDCFYNKRSTMKPRRYVQRNSSSAHSARYVSDFKFSNGDHSSDSWKPRSVRKQNQTNPFLHKQNSQQNQFLKNRFRNDYDRSSMNVSRWVSKPKHFFGPTQKQLWRKTPVKNQDEQRASSIDGPPEDAIYQEATYIDDFGQSKTAMAWISHSN